MKVQSHSIMLFPFLIMDSDDTFLKWTFKSIMPSYLFFFSYDIYIEK